MKSNSCPMAPTGFNSQAKREEAPTPYWAWSRGPYSSEAEASHSSLGLGEAPSCHGEQHPLRVFSSAHKVRLLSTSPRGAMAGRTGGCHPLSQPDVWVSALKQRSGGDPHGCLPLLWLTLKGLIMPAAQLRQPRGGSSCLNYGS